MASGTSTGVPTVKPRAPAAVSAPATDAPGRASAADIQCRIPSRFTHRLALIDDMERLYGRRHRQVQQRAICDASHHRYRNHPGTSPRTRDHAVSVRHRPFPVCHVPAAARAVGIGPLKDHVARFSCQFRGFAH